MRSYYKLEVRLPAYITYKRFLGFYSLSRLINSDNLKVTKKENSSTIWEFYFNEDFRADVINALTAFKEALKKNKLWMYK